MEKRHIFICGKRPVGKSTLIEKLIKELNMPVYGFFTRMLEAGENGFWPLHMFSPNDFLRIPSAENHVADCKGQRPNVNVSVFDTLGLELLKKRPGILVMDELGIMERASPKFCEAVIQHLDGDEHVIATVKEKNSDFLNKVRNHPKAQCYEITVENRDELYEILLTVIRSWNIEN